SVGQIVDACCERFRKRTMPDFIAAFGRRLPRSQNASLSPSSPSMREWSAALATYLDIYIGHDASECRAEADRRVARCLVKLTEAEVALSEKQREVDLRNAQDAGPVTIPTHRARYMRDEANVIAAWLTKPILHKPTDFDIHAQIEMQRKIA